MWGYWFEFLGKWGGEREGETGVAKKGKKNLLPLPFERHGRRRYTVPFKTTPFWIFFPVNSE